MSPLDSVRIARNSSRAKERSCPTNSESGSLSNTGNVLNDVCARPVRKPPASVQSPLPATLPAPVPPAPKPRPLDIQRQRTVTVKEAAYRLGKSEDAIYKWLRSGRLQGWQPGGRWCSIMVLESSVEKALLSSFGRAASNELDESNDSNDPKDRRPAA